MDAKIVRKLVMSLILVVALVGLLTLNARADLIVGDISFGGNVTPNNFNLNLATKFSTFGFIFVTAVDGDYSAITVPPPPANITPTTFTPFGFRAPDITATPFQLWTLNFGGDTYSFDAASMAITNSSVNSLELKGNGTAHITNFDDTPGTWVITANNAGSTFSFSSSAAVVPEPATMLLLGSGLLGLGVYARKRFSKK